MNDPQLGQKEAYAFILQYIESVPHLEALLLLWNTRPESWSVERVAERLYLQPDAAAGVLRELSRQQLIGELPGSFSYVSSSEDLDRIIEAVDTAYRRELIAVSTLIHSKTSRAAREFANAFRFKKENG